MSSTTRPFYKIWIDQCEASVDIRERYGLEQALDYLVGEKLFHFLLAAETHAECAMEVPAFASEVRRIFSPRELAEYMDHLEQTRIFAPLEEAEEDLEAEDEESLADPVTGAEELLRYSRMRALLLSREQ